MSRHVSAGAETQRAPLPKGGYRTSPDQETTAWPPGIPYIIGNEACERFSFYGMKAILYAHLVTLYVLANQVEERAKDLATATTHFFNTGVYALPMIGAILADRLVGKYRTIFYLSLVYCAGHGVLALVDLAAADQKLMVMYLGLGLIAVGSGGIKPCVSANVGDQFGKGNWFRVRTVYQIFYFSINFGSFFSTLSIPLVREYWGAGVAFAIPGILMLIATILFWMGRKKFVHVPPKPGGKLGLLDTLSSVALFLVVGHFFLTAGQPWWVMLAASALFLVVGLGLFSLRQRLAPDDGFLAVTFYALGRLFSRDKAEGPAAVERAAGRDGGPGGGVSDDTAGHPPLARSSFWGPAVERFGLEATEGPVAVLKIISVFFLVSVFWALFDQHSSSWIRQATMMDLTLFPHEVPLTTTFFGQEVGIVLPSKVLPTQVPALNPLMVMLLIPLMNLLYTYCDKVGLKTTPLRRITVGMLIAALSFVAVAFLQERIDAQSEGTVWFAWQIIPYLLITVAEVMVSITGLEFAYTQAPKRMKSIIMGFWMLTVAWSISSGSSPGSWQGRP
jgi:POT family proton-dependent oligopeptide transporter